MVNGKLGYEAQLHCRAGSLENSITNQIDTLILHCRAGSLEIFQIVLIILHFLHCRAGSLERLQDMTRQAR